MTSRGSNDSPGSALGETLEQQLAPHYTSLNGLVSLAAGVKIETVAPGEPLVLPGFEIETAAVPNGSMWTTAYRITADKSQTFNPAQRRHLLEAMLTNCLIEEVAIWYSSRSEFKSRVVFRLPYQRFSDHLVARHLLKTHLDVSSVTTIRRSFSAKSPLARRRTSARRLPRGSGLRRRPIRPD